MRTGVQAYRRTGVQTYRRTDVHTSECRSSSQHPADASVGTAECCAASGGAMFEVFRRDPGPRFQLAQVVGTFVAFSP